MNLRAIAVYLRVSTSRQDLRSQEPEFQTWLQINAGDRPVVWYRDQHAGRSLDRPALERLERDLIAAGTLLVCLAEQIAVVDVEPLALGMVGWHKELDPVGETTVVFRGSAFDDDVAKTNLAAILLQHGLENMRSL